MLRLIVAGCLSTVLAVVTFAQEVPNVIVERQWFHGDRAVRITLFDNKMAVTTVREQGRQVFFRQLKLDDVEYGVYVKALSEVAAEAGVSDRVPVEAIDVGAKVVLNLPDVPQQSFSYSPLQILDLATGRLVAVLDDLELRVTEVSPSQEALRLWVPTVGERVELFVGGESDVTEVREDGVLILENPDTGIITVVPWDQRHLVILRVLD